MIASSALMTMRVVLESRESSAATRIGRSASVRMVGQRPGDLVAAGRVER